MFAAKNDDSLKLPRLLVGVSHCNMKIIM